MEPNWIPYRDSAWAMELLGYSPARRSAFWQFVHGNQVPLIRVGKKKIMFSERAVRDWLAHHSSTGEA